MPLKSVTLLTCHESMFWLNAVPILGKPPPLWVPYPSNILAMLVNEPICHELRGWSNLAARENMKFMFMTRPTCHESMFWSNAMRTSTPPALA